MPGIAAEVEKWTRLEKEGRAPRPFAGSRAPFAETLSRKRGGEPLAIIAEYKRASPSRGDICLGLSPGEVAAQYWESGASACSILTEKQWFKGHGDYLAEAARFFPGPLLRKDFIAHTAQIRATAATPASAVLLIVRLTLFPDKLRELITEAAKYGLEAVVEIFAEEELAVAREAGAKIIQVNARDLASLKVDRSGALAIIRRNPPRVGETWIAASGVESGEHLREAAEAGFRGALVGTALMRDGRPGLALKRLLGKINDN